MVGWQQCVRDSPTVLLEILQTVPLVANATICNQRTLNFSRQPMVPLVPMLPLVETLVPMVPLGVANGGSVRGSPNGTIGNFTNGTIGSQWYHWLTNGTSGTIGRANGTIGITIGTNGIMV